MNEMVKEVHVCPILMRTVIFEDGKCKEDCEQDSPIIMEEMNHYKNSSSETKTIITSKTALDSAGSCQHL